ncbi:Predicted enolase-phosphatase [Pantoea agglomerans]|uniref:Predicted enolase-phosphatase n=1 Tax=Enterobacter agglomerans TaxID=549 RepID=A0A379AKW7_ENTAG|nr:Predicted enolase-phosphatase [Pantoea agglomerans]
MIRAIVTDIEGTTSDIRFVHNILFPYARQHLASFLRENAHQPNVAAALQSVREEAGQPQADLDAVTEILLGVYGPGSQINRPESAAGHDLARWLC